MAGPDSDFSQKYKGAIIFLVLLLVVTVILVVVYLMLKRGLSCICCPCCGKKKADEEEGLYDDQDEEEEEEMEDEMPLGNGDVPHDEEEIPMAEEELPPPDVPEIIVTEGTFKPEKKSKVSSMFKKMKKVKGRVRFSSSNEKVAIVTDVEPRPAYGSTHLTPLQRTDSMESFMSSMSTATTNVEEFGEDLSPSRIQVFIQYDPKLWILTVGAKQAECLVSTSKETMYWQAHMTLLPFKKHKFKTKYKSSSTPIFNQNFEIENIAQQALTQLSVRYRVYGRAGRAGRKKIAGETEVELSHICQMEDRIIKDWRVLRRAGGPAIRHESEV